MSSFAKRFEGRIGTVAADGSIRRDGKAEAFQGGNVARRPSAQPAPEKPAPGADAGGSESVTVNRKLLQQMMQGVDLNDSLERTDSYRTPETVTPEPGTVALSSSAGPPTIIRAPGAPLRESPVRAAPDVATLRAPDALRAAPDAPVLRAPGAARAVPDATTVRAPDAVRTVSDAAGAATLRAPAARDAPVAQADLRSEDEALEPAPAPEPAPRTSVASVRSSIRTGSGGSLNGSGVRSGPGALLTGSLHGSGVRSGPGALLTGPRSLSLSSQTPEPAA